MKIISLLISLFLFPHLLFSQEDYAYSLNSWSIEEVEQAQPSEDIRFLDSTSAEVVFLINLMRINPQKFNATIVVPNQVALTKNFSQKYVQSLIRDLKKQPVVPLLHPSQPLTNIALTHASYLGKTGRASHHNSKGQSPCQRIKKVLDYSSCGENIDLGNNIAINILFNLLVDDGLPELGHRKNLLRENYSLIGIGIDTHKKYGYVCVMDFASK